MLSSIDNKDNKKSTSFCSGNGLNLTIACGVAVGAAVGAATGNLAVWTGIGVAIGVSLGSIKNKNC